MNKQEIVKFCYIVLLISMSVCLIAASFHLVMTVVLPYRVKVDSMYLQDEIVNAMITSGVAQDVADIRDATN